MLKEYTMAIAWQRLMIPTLLPLVKDCQQYCGFVRSNNCADLSAVSYRSDALAESAHRVLPQSCHTPFSADVAEAFSQYLARKAKVLQDHKVEKGLRGSMWDPLSLLLVNWRNSLFDGACTPETYDYIDKDCIPGWDTWLAIVTLEQEQDGHALLCWVPPELCREVDSAIALDAASCMSWLAFDRHSNKPFVVGWGQRWAPSECR